MDVTAASALAAYNYQTTLQASGGSAAVLQSLAQAYTNQGAAVSGASGSPDILTLLSESSAQGALASGLYAAYTASGGDSSAIVDLLGTGSQDTSALSTLFGGKSSGLAGQDVSAVAAEAVYQYQLAAGTSASAASSYLQQLALAAKTSSLAAPLDLLA